jgi:hypothetical protein
MKMPVKPPIKTGKKYYTAEGYEVRIYATDGAPGEEVHGAVKINGQWFFNFYSSDGSSYKHMNGREIAFEEWKPHDKELVWCWDEGAKFERALRFYDKKNNRTFNGHSGQRAHFSWDYYAPYEGEWPKWAKEAVKDLRN